MRTALLAIAITMPGTGCSQAAPPPPAGCATVTPAEISGPAPRWLGSCASGKATGVGVLRVGARAPYAFFFGRVTSGRPRTGLVMLGNGNVIEIRGLAIDGRILPTDSEKPAQQDEAWADAAAGARAVAARFRSAGNTASAAYYADWVRKIETQRPE